MKVAIVCDWLVTYAGAERVIEAMIHCFPEADVFAVVDFVPEAQRAFLQGKLVSTTFIQKLPFAKRYYRAYLPLMPLAIEQLDVSPYDVVLSSSHAVSKGVLTHADQLHISYVHSPMRYAWDLHHDYLNRSGLNRGIKSYLARYMLHKMRLWDQRTAHGVDYFIANSAFIARRIWKTYRRPATVIYPPIDTTLFFPGVVPKDHFYLTASRLVAYKKIDLIVESFSQFPNEQLIVMGDGPDRKKIEAVCPTNVHLLGFQPTSVLRDYMQRAQAFIMMAEEDFGIVALEAQACGTPVIAFNKGGLRETVCGLETPLPTGIFFDQQKTSSLCDALRCFQQEKEKILSTSCVQQAQKFTQATFNKRFLAFINEVTKVSPQHQPKNKYPIDEPHSIDDHVF